MPLAWRTLMSVMLLTISLGCSAESKQEQVVEGKHYKKVDSSIDKVGPKESIEVMEFFSYGCPHCADLEAGVKKWKADLPTFVTFDHMPAFWNETYALLAQAYYTAKLMEKESELRPKIFDAWHNKRQRWSTPEEIKAFFVQHGVDAKEFDRNFTSFAVRQKMKMADNAFRNYKLRSVPVFVVAGQYVTSVSDAGSEEHLWKTLNHLTAKIKAGEL